MALINNAKSPSKENDRQAKSKIMMHIHNYSIRERRGEKGCVKHHYTHLDYLDFPSFSLALHSIQTQNLCSRQCFQVKNP